MTAVDDSFPRITAGDFLEAARVPHDLKPQAFGLWQIQRAEAANVEQLMRMGWGGVTMLRRSLPCGRVGECVMEDSRVELSRHLPIGLAASGRVLVSGLGLGCVVRGLLANPRVSHVDVVEIDPDIVRVVGPEFVRRARCTVHTGDALTYPWPPGTGWDYAWHDIWSETESLDALHIGLMMRYDSMVGRQGAWMLHRELKRTMRSLYPALIG